MRSSVLDTYPAPQQVTYPVYPPASQPFPQPQMSPPPRSPRQSALASAQRSRRRVLSPLEGWTTLVLLAVALYSVVFAMIAANWVRHSPLLLLAPVLGLLLGLGVAKLPHVPQSILHIGSCLVGYWFAVWLTAFAFHISWGQVLLHLRDAVIGGLTSGVVPSGEDVFFFYLVFLCFFLGHFGSWLIYRAHLPWLVALVYSSILLVNLNYIKQSGTYLYVVILLAALILLVARMQMVSQVMQWMREGLYINRSWFNALIWRCMSMASVVMVLALLAGLLLPVLQQPEDGKAFWDKLDNAINNISNGHISWQDPASLIQPFTSQANFFGDQLIVSNTVNLPTGEVLNYSSTQPLYLEGFTYNMFDGRTWTTSLTARDARAYRANEQLPLSTDKGSQQLIADITVLQPPAGTKYYIFGPAEPIRFSVPTVIYSDGTTGTWTKQQPLMKGERYIVTSIAPAADAQGLRAFPLPASDREGIWQEGLRKLAHANLYLQVPQKLPPVVEQTAKQWTQGATDAYSALKMLESHLGNQKVFTYSIENEPIPQGRDVVSWLLEKKIGYCTYYASAMAIMARQLGIPTRIVNGFSQGHFDNRQNRWSVMGSDAHSWVQAYFPSYGWISFDPTPGYSLGAGAVPQVTPAVAATPSATQATPTPSATQAAAFSTSPTPPAQQQDRQGAGKNAKAQQENPLLNQTVLIVVAVFLLLCSLGVLISGLVVHWWRNLYAGSPFVSGIFWRLCWLARWLGLAPRPWQTPYEYGSMLSRHFPEHAQPLWRLTDLFVRERWGAPQQAPHALELQEVERFWPILHRSLLRALWQRKRR